VASNEYVDTFVDIEGAPPRRQVHRDGWLPMQCSDGDKRFGRRQTVRTSDGETVIVHWSER
jgi:hypothetical protein